MDSATISATKKRIRQPPHILDLCDGLSVHYTFSPISVANRKRGNTANQIKLYLYSSSLKRKVGADVRLRYTTPLKKVRKTSKKRHNPPAEKVLEGVQKLLAKNEELRECDLTKTPKEASALSAKLVVFWLQKQSSFQTKYSKSSHEASSLEKMMAQVILCLGNLDLSRLLDEHELPLLCTHVFTTLRKVVERRAYMLIQESLSKSVVSVADFDVLEEDQNVTQRLYDYGALLQKVFREYLLLQSISDEQQNQILALFKKQFTVRSGVGVKMGKGLRPKSLSVDDYRLLWKALTKEPGNSLALAQLLMLFLGLTAEEVCALDSEDLLPIPNYRAYQLRITKRCVPIKKNDNDKNYIVSGELPSSESYRNVPVPFLLVKLILQSAQAPQKPLFCDDKTGQRIKVNELQAEFRKLFRDFKKSFLEYHRDDGQAVRIQVSFRPENYRQSCRHFWQFLCGLQQNEIRYLGGLAQIDTAGQHYIDFNNAHKQYHMCVQMSYGLMAVAAPGALPPKMPKGSLERKCHIEGVFNHVLHTRLHIRRPCTVTITSAHGVTIKTEEGCL